MHAVSLGTLRAQTSTSVYMLGFVGPILYYRPNSPLRRRPKKFEFKIVDVGQKQYLEISMRKRHDATQMSMFTGVEYADFFTGHILVESGSTR